MEDVKSISIDSLWLILCLFNLALVYLLYYIEAYLTSVCFLIFFGVCGLIYLVKKTPNNSISRFLSNIKLK